MESQGETQALVRRAQGGDRTAFEELFRRHRARLEKLIDFQLKEPLRSQVDVDDVLQETLLRAFESLWRFEWRDEDSFLRWLAGIGRNVVRQVAARHKRRHVIALEGELSAGDLSPSRLQRRRERLDRFQESIDKLSPDHRQVIFLARVQKLPIRVIAERMNRSPDAVSHLLMRAVTKLRDSFGETDSFHLPDRLRWGEENDGDLRST